MSKSRFVVYALFFLGWVTQRSVDLAPPGIAVTLTPEGQPRWTRNGALLHRNAPLLLSPPRSALGLPIPLNQAGVDLLMEVPGIGPSRARAIVKYRNLKGCFSKMSDLDGVRGFGTKTVVKVAPFLTVGGSQEPACASRRSG